MPDRLFLGVPLAAEARAALSAQIGELLPPELPVRPVPPANWHLTLRFLGATAPELLADLRVELSSAELGNAFPITFGGLGTFPRASRARALWIGISAGLEPLQQLAGAVERCARSAGFEPDERPFSPHLTLARLREPTDLSQLVATAIPPTVSQTVAEIVLFRSHLGAGPPRYEPVDRFSLS